MLINNKWYEGLEFAVKEMIRTGCRARIDILCGSVALHMGVLTHWLYEYPAALAVVR